MSSVLNFKFSLSSFTFLRSLACFMSIEQKISEEKIFRLQSMSKAIICINQRFAIKNSFVSCLTPIQDLESTCVN